MHYMSSQKLSTTATVYAIYFAYRYFHDFGLGGEIRDFSDVFITIKLPYMEVKIFVGTDLEIHRNKTTA